MLKNILLGLRYLFFLSIIGHRGVFAFDCEQIVLSHHPTPTQPSKSYKTLHAIVLANAGNNFPSTKILADLLGIQAIDLVIPGSIASLQKKLFSLYKDRPISMELVDEIKQAVIKHYHDHGHPLVTVTAPNQELSSGSLQLIVQESCFGKVSVEGNEHFSSESLKKYIKLKSGDHIDEQTLIRNLNLINRNPFRHADLMYYPGEELGTTDLILRIKDRRTLRLYAGIDNTGVQTTGHNRLYAGINLGDVFKRGDIFGYQYTSSDDFSQFQAHTMQYTGALPWDHILNVYGGYSSVDAKLSRIQASVLQSDGSSTVFTRTARGQGYSGQASLRYLIPFFLSRYLLHDVIVGFDWKRMNNRTVFGGLFPIVGKNATLTQLVLGYVGDYQRSHYRLDFETNFYFSPASFLPDQTNHNYQSLTPKAKTHYIYWHGSLISLIKLPREFSLRLRSEGQISSANLLPSEEFGLGGYETVRGYSERVVNKENILLLSGEMRSPPIHLINRIKSRRKIPTDALQALIFIDYAVGRNKFSITPDSPPQDFPQQTEWLMGIGPGLRYTIDPFLTARLDWGFKLHKNKAIGQKSQKIHFAVTASY